MAHDELTNKLRTPDKLECDTSLRGFQDNQATIMLEAADRLDLYRDLLRHCELQLSRSVFVDYFAVLRREIKEALR